MTSDGILILQIVFGVIWRLFTSWYVPGTSVTPGMMLVFLAFAGIVWRVIRSFNGAIRAPGALDHPLTRVDGHSSAWGSNSLNSQVGSGSSLVKR